MKRLDRLAAYLLVCLDASERQEPMLRSGDFADLCGVLPPFVRRDLSLTPDAIGKRGVGYRVDTLTGALERELARIPDRVHYSGASVLFAAAAHGTTTIPATSKVGAYVHLAADAAAVLDRTVARYIGKE